MVLVLASASPRRLELLGRLGLEPLVAPAEVDETPHDGERPAPYVARVAAAKAAVARAAHAGAWIVAADTTVTIDDQILGKPADQPEARRMMEQLAGRRHHVLTATCVVRPDGRELRRVVDTEVVMRALGAAELLRYLASGEWQGRAGGYAAQGIAAGFITEIHGSYTSVVGLPLAEIAIDLEPLLL